MNDKTEPAFTSVDVRVYQYDSTSKKHLVNCQNLNTHMSESINQPYVVELSNPVVMLLPIPHLDQVIPDLDTLFH